MGLAGKLSLALSKSVDISGFEKVSLRVSSMRGTVEYEIAEAGDGNVTVSRWAVRYIDGEDVRELDAEAILDRDEALSKLEEFNVCRWNGFHGQHPALVHDGDMFALEVVAQGSAAVSAEGSDNFPSSNGSTKRFLKPGNNRTDVHEDGRSRVMVKRSRIAAAAVVLAALLASSALCSCVHSMPQVQAEGNVPAAIDTASSGNGNADNVSVDGTYAEKQRSDTFR